MSGKNVSTAPCRPTTLGSDSETWWRELKEPTGNTSALVPRHGLRDARGDHADAVLARANAFDDRDVGVTHVLLRRRKDIIEFGAKS